MKKFPIEDAWLINPGRSRRSTKKRKVSMARRRRSRKSAKRSHRRKRSVVVIKANPGRRRRRSSAKVARRSRRYRRNPGGVLGILPSKASLFDAVYVTGGFIGTKIAAGFVMPMIGVQQPIVRIGVKAVLAGVMGWAGSKVLGKSAGQYLMIGGLVETVNDAVQTYVTPFVPALAVNSYPELGYYDMNAYPEMGSYPGLSGAVHDDMSEVV